MFKENELDLFFNDKNYDVRESGNARWIDQKCTPDVVCIIADCILNYIEQFKVDCFTTKDIWDSSYANEITDLFSKPDIHNKKAKNEYDKFFQQPMELLAYSGVLSKKKNGSKNEYSVVNAEILEFISIREKNTLKFLTKYITHVLKDSDLLNSFNNFFTTTTSDSFVNLKKEFEEFTIKYTAINQVTECRRIFTKVLNPLAFDKGTFGTVRGHLSKHKISYDQLMYNRLNFRDLYSDKPKDITRNDHEPSLSEKEYLKKYWKYNSNKAKKLLRKFNDEFNGKKSEHIDEWSNADAIHMHHIFPESSYPSISGHIENLIALTPSQHLGQAHPAGNTQIINKDYQYLLLLSKSNKIENNLNQNQIPIIYDFDKFKEVLVVGLNNPNIYSIQYMDFPSIGREITNYFNI